MSQFCLFFLWNAAWKDDDYAFWHSAYLAYLYYLNYKHREKKSWHLGKISNRWANSFAFSCPFREYRGTAFDRFENGLKAKEGITEIDSNTPPYILNGFSFVLELRETIYGRSWIDFYILLFFLDIPELVVLETRPSRNLSISTVYFTQCQPSWDDETDLYSQLVKFALLYALPLLFISVTYYQIVRVLWRSARLAITGGNRTADNTDESANSTTGKE